MILSLASLAIAAPAMAEKIGLADPADAKPSPSDVRRMTVDHGANELFVKVRFTDLRRNSEAGPSGIAIFIDTSSAIPGPEYRLGSGLQAGSDYQLVRMKDGKPVGAPLICDHRVRLDFGRDLLKFRAARTCLKSPDELRVGAKMTDLYDGSHPITDWLRQPRSYTKFLAAG